MRNIAAPLWALLLSIVLAGCGGGGGSSDSASASGRAAALSFSPVLVTTNVATSTSTTLTVRATASDPAIFNGAVYVYVVDPAHVLAQSVELSSIDARTFSVTLHTSPSLAVGRYTGNFQIQLCKDPNCASQFPGSPVLLPYDLTITPAPLQANAGSSTAATVHRGGSLDNQVVVSVSSPALAWTATSTVPWLQVSGGTGTGPGAFSVGYATQTLAEGQYAGTVSVRASDGQTVSLPFTLDVLPTQFTLTSGIPSFAAVNGAPIAAQTLGFALDNGVPTPWSATSSAPWMLVDLLAGTTPAVVSLRPDPSRGALASGSYSSDLVLSAAGVPNRTVTSQLMLSPPTLSAPTLALTFGGPRGRDLSAQSLALSLNTGANRWPFTLSGLPGWLTTGALSGMVDQGGTSLSFTPNPAAITAGSRTATLTLSATVNGDSAVLPLTMNLNADQRRLLASEWGVGLASTPTGNRLGRTLTISDNFAGTLNWTASSDAAWLAATASGNTTGSGNLVLNADASTLPAEALSVASVTVTSTTAGVEPAVIRVGLWKSASGLATVTTLPLGDTQLAVDRIRPYVYTHAGGTSVDVYNAYTAQKLATISGVGAALGAMSVSPDGRRLYVLDTAARALAVVDLGTRSLAATWPLVNAVSSSTSLLAVRPNGVEVVLVGDGTAYAEGRLLGYTQASGPLAATPDGRHLFTLGSHFDLDHSAMAGGMLFISALNGLDSRSGGNARDVAVSPDGTRAYVASGGGADGRYRCAAIDGRSGSFIGALPGGEAYPNNVEVTSDGRAICGIAGWYAASDFWVHSAAGALLQGYKVAGYAKALRDGQLVVTPDGLVVVALTDDPLIAFVPIGP